MSREPERRADPRAARPRAGRRVLGLRAHLLGLVLAVLVPALAVGAVAAWHAAEGYRAASAARLLDTARALALAMDGEIGRAEAALMGLAFSRGLDEDGDLAAFDARARAVAAALGASIFVSGPGPDHHRVIDTALPPGTAAPAAVPVEAAANAPVARVFATGRTAVGDLARVRPGEQPLAAVVVPVVRDGRTLWAIGMTLAPARLSALLAAQGLSDGAFAAVADARGILVGRSRDPERYVGRPANGWYAAPAPPAGALGVTQARSADGEAVLLASERLRAAPGWAVAVATPYAAHLASWQAPLRGLAIGAAVALALAAALVACLARRLLRPVEALAVGARAVADADGTGPGLAIAAPRSTIAEFEALRLGIADAEAALRRRVEAERRAEAALRESDRRVRELQAEFLRAARLGEIGQMAATLANELNQPLAAAANYVNGSRRLLDGGAEAVAARLPVVREALAAAAEQTVQAGRIVRRMRGFVARSDGGRRPEDLAELVGEAAELASLPAGRRQVEIRIETGGPRMPRVLADRTQVQQVLVSLMHNAIEAMEASERRTLTVTARPAAGEPGMVEVAVADTGPGLPAEVAADLFKPFVTTKPGGAGVGLAVCRTIVEAHGGRIRAEPNPDGGTIFRFTLPVAAPAPVEQERAAPG